MFISSYIRKLLTLTTMVKQREKIVHIIRRNELECMYSVHSR